MSAAVIVGPIDLQETPWRRFKRLLTGLPLGQFGWAALPLALLGWFTGAVPWLATLGWTLRGEGCGVAASVLRWTWFAGSFLSTLIAVARFVQGLRGAATQPGTAGRWGSSI